MNELHDYQKEVAKGLTIAIAGGVCFGMTHVIKEIEKIQKRSRNILLDGSKLTLCTDKFVTPLDAQAAANKLGDIILGLSATPFRASDLADTSKPKKVKFHNNLRQQLNTGGIKWL